MLKVRGSFHPSLVRRLCANYRHASIQLFPDADLRGLAVDPASRLIFYSDASNDLIALLIMSSLATKTVINSSLDEPRDIVLDTADG